MTKAPAVILFPRRDDLLAHAARHIVSQAGTLPDLTDTVVLLPDLLFATDLRRHLLLAAREHDCRALLGPHINTLPLWLAGQVPLAQEIPGRARRELMLVEAIQAHAGLFGGQDPWSLASTLITLFDELTLNRVPVDVDPAAFTQRLQSAYGLAGALPEPFDLEARIVQRLWSAWHIQLQAGNMLDPNAALLARLASCDIATGTRLYFVGLDAVSNAEAEWIGTVIEQGNGECLLHQPAGNGEQAVSALQSLLATATHSAANDDPFTRCLDSIFATPSSAMQARTAALRERTLDSPLTGRLHSFAAASPEQEARAIELQVRRWLLDGKQPLAIVTEDRRLGRRVRALLERAGISLQDPGGWALSTTRAAAALERWLQTVEEDFAHEPLLDTLKSTFILPDEDREQLGNCVFRFETDIIRREQIARGLQRYREQIDKRLEHFKNRWTVATTEQMQVLLNQLDHAAEPLRHCLSGEHSTRHLLEQLRDSLLQLGMWRAFEDDPAGQRVLQEWQLLFSAATHSDLHMSWADFRAWLGSALERHVFRPAPGDSPVMLLTLAQASLGRFAGIVVGACDTEYLPPAPTRSPFFNDRVHAELGLPTWPQQYHQQLQRFHTLLESAPRVLLTWHRENNGEERTPSPWLARIEAFQRMAWMDTLVDDTLEALIDHPHTRVAGHHPLAAPTLQPAPRVTLPAGALPKHLSVSAHGTLIDCPYLFFAASGLRLRAREEVRLALEKAGYGSLVHRALEIFHQGHNGFPAPLKTPLNAANREAAIILLDEISQQLFSQELEDNYEHRAWLRRWQLMIPEYIDWQTRHQANWQFNAGEQEGLRALAGVHTLEGRVDRVDSNPNGSLVIDYKTGAAPDQAAVDSGEAVQLPSYALLLPQLPAAVQYVMLDSKVSDGSRLEGAELADLATQVLARLEHVLGQIESGTPLPAWGDNRTCAHCEMDGLCRKQAWPDA
jgi:ATP-dependent helicase/nuclease subunit B